MGWFMKSMACKPKIIAMTGGGRYGGTENYLEMAKGLGASKVFTKPVNISTLLLSVNELLD